MSRSHANSFEGLHKVRIMSGYGMQAGQSQNILSRCLAQISQCRSVSNSCLLDAHLGERGLGFFGLT